MVKRSKVEEKRPGYNWDKKLFSFNLSIVKSYQRDGKRWKPRKPGFEELEDSWVIIEFSPLSLAHHPVLGLVGEPGFADVLLQNTIDLDTLQQRSSVGLDADWIYAVHVLESPEVSRAKEVIKEVETEELYKARESGISNPAHVIRKLKEYVSEARVAELINVLMSNLETSEDATDEVDILGEKLAGRPSKVKKELDEFVEKHESVQQWVKAMEERGREIDAMSTDEMISDIRRMNEKNDDIEIEMYAHWIRILSSMRDKKVDDVIRNLYFEIKSLK